MKRFICILLIIFGVLGLNGCKDTEVSLSETSRVAVASDSDETIAAKTFCDNIDGQLIEYQSSFDAVTAVENGKADCVILNEYEAQNFIDAERELTYFETCEHKLECRAIFNLENDELCRQFNKAFSGLKKDGTLEKIKIANIKGEKYDIPESSGEKGELIMLCDPIFENRVYYENNSELKGTDIDIAKTVCAYLGYTLVTEVADFDEMFIALESGNADFIMSSAEFTEARAEHFLISDVYSTLEYNVYIREQ